MSILIKQPYFAYFYFLLLLNPMFSCASSAWQQGKLILALGSGANITSQLGDSKKFPFNHPIIDTQFHYSPNKKAQVEPLYDVYIAKEWKASTYTSLALGIGYNQTSPFEANGSFQQGVLPFLSQINNDYRYSIRLKQILIESKWGYLLKERYRPYLTGGLGVAINTASHYRAYVPFPALTRQYTNHTENNFSYRLGLGIDVDLLSKIRLGVGYRFSDFGKVQMGQAKILNYQVSQTLSESSLYSNEILAQLTYVFN